jgi:hypothetical protein
MLECYFCGKKIESTEAAIEAEWVPGFFDPNGDVEILEPVCPGCNAEHLEADETGELVRVTD